MDLPTLGEFKTLLQEDKVFRDYFNSFLNLPVFAKRLTYSSVRKTFVVEPRVKRSYHTLNEPGLLPWVHRTRLPLFWSTDLHLESRLAQDLLSQSKQDGSSVSAMDKFRHFLCQTEGECVWLFWKDVERLRLTSDKRLVHKVLHHIQLTYLQNGALMTLTKCVAEKAVLNVREKLSGGVCRLQLLFNAQKLALEELLMYWSLRYTIHLNKNESAQTTISKTFSNMRGMSSDKHIGLPSIIYDQGNTGESERPDKVSHIKLSSFSLPSLMGNLPECDVKRSKHLHPLITPSTCSLFPRQTNFSNQSTSSLRSMPHLSVLSASLRADFLAGNPFLHYLINLGAHNHLLFWQSVENILTQDEMKRWSNKQKQCGLNKIVFFEEYPIARDLRQLLALFLKTRAPNRVDLPEGMKSREMCLLLEKGLGHNLLLSAQDYSSQELFGHWKDYLLTDHHNFMKSCTNKKVLRRIGSHHQRCRTLTAELSPSPTEIIEQVFEPTQLQEVWRAMKYAETAKYHGIHLLPSRTQPPTLPPATPTDGDEYLLDLADVDAPISLDGVALSPMMTTICDQLLYDWKECKSKRDIICTTTHSFESTKRPQIPMSLMEVLRDREQLEFFRHFLFMHGTNAETPLQFWMAVEDIKTCLGNKKAFGSKLRRIQERFCVGRGGSSHLRHHPVFYELSKWESPSILQLIAAQVDVVKTIEKTWFDEYVQHLQNKENEETEKEEERKSACKASTKGLWGMFAHNVISFRRGLMNSVTAEQFRSFLREEVIKGSSGHSPKKVIGTKVVNVTKLLNDLSFWVEVERYKDLADMIRAGKEKGTHTPEDDIMVHKKAHAIVNCYVDSSVSPRVQINIPNDLVGVILDNISQGLISRGLFHEAALNIFSVLILYWKKFCVYRFAPKGKGGQSASIRHGTPSIFHSDVSRHTLQGEEEKDWHSHYFWEGGPILAFNLTAGVKWHYPPNYHQILQHHLESPAMKSKA